MSASTTTDGRFRFAPLDSAALDRAADRHDYLVDGVLVRGQPAVLGGPKKALKTSLCVDLVVSVATGAPFLGRFRVSRPARAALLSGESGVATLRDTARRVCAARGVSLPDADALWQTTLPRLSDPADRRAVADGLRARGVGLVVIDPLYLCLLGGLARASAANLYEIGPLLHDVAADCLGAGATPVFVHHAVKRAGTDGPDPLALDDLAFAGIGEVVRQWLLVSRRAEYRGGGEHDLTLSVGGSAGHSGGWRVRVSEGRTGTDLQGRRWEVQVTPADGGPDRGDAGRPRIDRGPGSVPPLLRSRTVV